VTYNYLFTNVDIEVQILTEEDLINFESVDFPSISNSSMLDKMTPMIQIPTSILLNQLEVQGYTTIMYTFTRNLILLFVAGKRVAVVNAVTRNVHLPTDPGYGQSP